MKCPELSVAINTFRAMEDEWVEPRARRENGFNPEQEQRGRQLVARDDLLTGERQTTRLALGDLLLEVAPPAGNGVNSGTYEVLKGFAAVLGISLDTAREYRRVAAACTGEIRDRLAQAGVLVPYSVIREAAVDDGSASAAGRWQTLFQLLDEAAGSGERVTVPRYRQALGSQPTVQPVLNLTPEQVLQQMDREDVRAAVLACVTRPDFLRETLLTDPMAEVNIREGLAHVERATRKTALPSQQSADSGDEQLLHRLRRRVNTVREVVRMHPEQVLNIADHETLDELTEIFRTLADWLAAIENGKKETAR
ncbi:hypothetical protein ACWC5C_38610 [Streptomyces sp. NPDC001700]